MKNKSKTEEIVEETWDSTQVAFVADYDKADNILYGYFQASAECPNGDYEAGQSSKTRFESDETAKNVPIPSTKNHNKLNIFLNSLQNGGWELLPDDAEPWYARKLRRKTKPVVEEKVTRKQWRWIIGIIIIMAIPSFFVIRTMVNPFPLGVKDYMELEPRETDPADYDPHIEGKLLVVNPLPLRLTDPLYGRPDPIHWALPDDMRAEHVDEIATVAWVACRSYNISRQISRDCEVTVFDPNTLVVFDMQEFLSEKRPAPVSARERIKMRDAEAIQQYLIDLPRR